MHGEDGVLGDAQFFGILDLVNSRDLVNKCPTLVGLFPLLTPLPKRSGLLDSSKLRQLDRKKQNLTNMIFQVFFQEDPSSLTSNAIN